MSKQMKDLDWAIEAERYEKETLRLLDEAYEQEQLAREAQQYGYDNIHSNIASRENYMAVEYSYLTA